MKICVIEADKGRKNGTSVNVHERNCRVIIRHLERRGIFCKYYLTDATIDESEQFDLILISYASYYMQIDKFLRLIGNQKKPKVGWMTNDYNLEINSCFKKIISFVISNHEQVKWKDLPYLMVNLNCLILAELNGLTTKKYDAIYYGTFRPGREEYFLKYLKGEMILSTSSKTMKKYKTLGCDCRYIDKIVWRRKAETLNLFRASLYIEDKKTHEHYSYLANRFYESISCNAIPLFDKSCRNTVKKSGYDISDDYFVDSYEDLIQKAKEFPNDIGQHDMIKFHKQAMAERDETLEKIYQFLMEIIHER